ncbi:MAG TPA: DUF4406 domain-containing protein [Pyrinomonadaceae bacterium]
MLIAVAGPYSAETAEQRGLNLEAMNKTAALVMKRGHIPVIGVNAALPVVEWLDADADKYEAMMTISLELVDRCDAILVIGESRGVTRERDLIRSKGLPVYEDINELPA